MAKRKCKCPESVPEWVVTFGDMMSLLLCFFILLAAFSELKKDEEYQEVVQAVKEQFGMTGGTGKVPTIQSPSNSMTPRLDNTTLQKGQLQKDTSISDDPGQHGKHTTVQRVREGTLFTIGGQVTFEPGQAALKSEAMVELEQIAEQIRGKNTKVEIRGHTANQDWTSESPFASDWELSYARAEAVMKFLTDEKRGIEPPRVRVVACGHFEPLKTRAYNDELHAQNRRIEIIAMEALVKDFETDNK